MLRLTKVEEEIMQIIWQLKRCTVSDIRTYMSEKLQIEKPPHSTISSIVRIVEDKGFLNHKAYGRTHEYFPIISKEDYSKRTLKKLVKDYFEGSMDNLVSFIVKENNIDLAELTEMLNQLEDHKTNKDD